MLHRERLPDKEYATDNNEHLNQTIEFAIERGKNDLLLNCPALALRPRPFVASLAPAVAIIDLSIAQLIWNSHRWRATARCSRVERLPIGANKRVDDETIKYAVETAKEESAELAALNLRQACDRRTRDEHQNMLEPSHPENSITRHRYHLI